MKSSAKVLTVLKPSMRTQETEVGNQIIRIKCGINYYMVKKGGIFGHKKSLFHYYCSGKHLLLSEDVECTFAAAQGFRSGCNQIAI